MSLIPKQILQIAIGEEYRKIIPLDKLRRLFEEINPEFTYILLTEIECINFLCTNYPEYLDLYNILNRVQYKSDLIRYLYIYKYGGIYIDIDLSQTIKFEVLLQILNNATSFFTIGNGSEQMANGFFGSVKDNIIFIECIDEMIKEPNPENYGTNVNILYSLLSKKYSMIPYIIDKDTFFIKEIGIDNTYKYYIHPDHYCLVKWF
jgi:mannosyltransferase OCH1-like enzyme